ncbi:helix-turn-helix domain-containing protein [Paenisporosarcina quisquiliarum]|uniref:helix-turn-helix domain-containing protein n=1 Tax=Paenisporosarcina quisquiliarum TaxID=365346 RepID=UPI003735F182
MNTFGHVIKFERIRQNIKQVKLADGICTPSYLSKIESNSIVPSEEILGLLFERLSIKLSSSKKDDNEFLDYVRSIYLEAIKTKDKMLVSKQLEEILNTHYLFKNQSCFYTYILMVIRLKIMVQKVNSDTLSYLSSISNFSSKFDSHQLLLFHSFNGYMHYYNNDRDNALQSLEKAKTFHGLSNLEDCESADFHFLYGLFNLHNNKIIVSLDFLSRAQSYFNKELLLLRSVESYITTAVAYQVASSLDKHFEYLMLAEHLALEGDMKENLALIYFNMATYYNLNKNIIKAIDYYHKCLHLTHNSFVYMKTVYCIILQNSMINNIDEVLKWSKKGIELFTLDPDELAKGLDYHFKIHLSLHSNFDKFEDIVTEAIQYFDKTKDYRHANKYAMLIAKYFYAAGKYKKATNYYQLATVYLAKKENRRFTEEI